MFPFYFSLHIQLSTNSCRLKFFSLRVCVWALISSVNNKKKKMTAVGSVHWKRFHMMKMMLLCVREFFLHLDVKKNRISRSVTVFSICHKTHFCAHCLFLANVWCVSHWWMWDCLLVLFFLFVILVSNKFFRKIDIDSQQI